MAKHVRQQIREYLKQFLTGLSTTGSAVFANVLLPVDAADGPRLNIYTLREQTEPSSIGPDRTLERELEVVIDGLCFALPDALSPADDIADAMALEVEQKFATDRTFGGLVHTSSLAQTTLEPRVEGDRTWVNVRLVYRCVYFTKETDPATAR